MMCALLEPSVVNWQAAPRNVSRLRPPHHLHHRQVSTNKQAFKGATSQPFESFLRRPELRFNCCETRNDGLLRKKNAWEVILNQKGTRMAEDGEDWNGFWKVKLFISKYTYDDVAPLNKMWSWFELVWVATSCINKFWKNFSLITSTEGEEPTFLGKVADSFCRLLVLIESHEPWNMSHEVITGIQKINQKFVIPGVLICGNKATSMSSSWNFFQTAFLFARYDDFNYSTKRAEM